MFHQQHKKSAIVTGGAKRVGAYIAKTLAMNGYDVVIHYNKSEKEAFETKKEIETTYPVNVILIQCDFLNFKSIKSFVDEAFYRLPHLNTLINNSSIFKQCNFMDTTEEIFDEHMNIHLKASFFIIKYFFETKKCLNVINMIDENILSKSSDTHFSYLLAKKSMMIFIDMLESKFKENDSIINSIMPGKILNSAGTTFRNFFILQNVIKYLLYTKETGLKICI